MGFQLSLSELKCLVRTVGTAALQGTLKALASRKHP